MWGFIIFRHLGSTHLLPLIFMHQRSVPDGRVHFLIHSSGKAIKAAAPKG
jgi:hypothetical protein